jgi:ribose transport system substrate-binding protein
MRIHPKVLFVTSVVLAAGLAASGCSNAGSGGEKRIILLTNGNSPFWDAGRAGMQEAEKDLRLHEAGLSAVFEVNNGQPQGQIDKLRQFATQSDVAGVCISAVDAANQRVAELMRELRGKGVQVLTFDSDVDRDHMRDARFAYLGTDNYAGGRELGRSAKGLRPSGGAYVTFVGRTGAQNAIERVNGFAEGAGDKFKKIDNMGDNMDRTRARENVRNAMTNHPEMNTLVGIWSYNAPAIVDIVREKENRKSYTIVVFDAEPLAIKQMAEGDIDALVVQNPYQMGYDAVKLMKALIQDDQKTVKEMLPNHGQPDGDIYDTGLKVVAPDDGSPLKAEMFDKKTQFLKLSEFRKWLDKYGLTGS